MTAEILIIDDESDIRGLIQGILEDEGYATRDAATDEQAYAHVRNKVPDLIVLDIWLQGSKDDGLQILENIKADHPNIPVLMISGHGTIETAVSAIKHGAYDFIEKPFKSDRLLLMIERALETAKLRKENETLRTKVQGPSDLIGQSPAMTTLIQTLERVAQTNSRVLISGEPGTGKDLAARFIHNHSQRGHNAFTVLNCAIMRPERLETELFGMEASADGQEVIGVLEQADGGTLLLDEVADMPLETQGKIVRVLQEQRFQRVGGQAEISVDVRIIASTNRDLKKAMEEGRFREDLYYRLSVVPIVIPPLRDRVQDIAELALYFSQTYSQQAGRIHCSFDQATIAAMQAYDWPGNVRQLRNVVEWCIIMGCTANDETVKPQQLPPEIVARPQAASQQEKLETSSLVSMPLREAREEFEREYLMKQIKRFGGNISKTAEFVGMERSALHRKLKMLGISTVSAQNDTDKSDSIKTGTN